MKKISLAIIFLCFAYTGFTQNTIKGVLTDTTNGANLKNAVVSVLRNKDSVLVTFSRAKEKGVFEINNLPSGKYIVSVSYPSYADYEESVDLNNTTKELGKIILTLKSKLLEEVIVKQRISAIRIKGDTTEFKADSFKVGPNADVQALLKKLPGITVNSKGEITAQGQRVEKVLVDGEEFFSDDPAVVTKNLRADIVDNVQVFDKKSDQAVFSGIDDGQKTKTINLQLKEDKKKGYFGKLEAGSDFDKYRSGKAMVNVFKGKKKAAFYITNDNTRFESLNWNERSNYGEDLNRTVEINDDGGMSMWSSGDNFSWGQGLPTSTTGGAHFSNKWNKDKHNSINTYQFNDLQVKGLNTSLTQTLLSDSNFIVANSTENFVNQRQRNRLRSTYDWQIDSTSSLKIVTTGSIIRSKSNNFFSSRSENSKGILLNNTDRTLLNDSEEQTLISNLFWRKRLKKKGRTISVTADINMNSRSGDGFLFANIQSPATGNTNTDQNKTNYERGFGVTTKAIYTEPLWKNTFLEVNYRYSLNKNNANQQTLEGGINGVGKYDKLVDSLSNHFVFNNSSHIGGMNFKYSYKKVNFSFGAGLGNVVFNLDDLRKANNNRSISFINFLPAANIVFQPKKQRRFSLSYNGNTNNPTIQQINPIINNIDPLNITIGNANLKQEFRHSFNLNMNDYKILKDRNIYVNASFTFVNNAITNANTIDPTTGKRTNQSINVNGNYNFNMWAGYGLNIIPNVNVDFQLNPTIRRFINMVNGQRNVNDSRNLGFRINSGYWGDKAINYWLGAGATFNDNTSSLSSINTKYWSYNLNSDFEFKMKKIKMYSNIETNFMLFQRTPVFNNQRDIFIVHASIRKSLDKAENWQLGIKANDIFNQNQQINRNITSNFISETTQQNIQRFVMLELTYNFSKNGKPSNGW